MAMSIVLILAGLVSVIVNFINFQDFREEARKNHDSAWPENFFNVSFVGIGMTVFLIGCALWARIDLRADGAMPIIVMIVGALSLLSFGIFLFNEKLMPRFSERFEKRRVKKEALEKMWQDYLARSTAAPGTKPAPKQPTKGPTAAKKTTPPTARK